MKKRLLNKAFRKFAELALDDLKDMPEEVKFLINWVVINNPEYNPTVKASRILQNNPDCAFTGTCYRLYVVEKDEFFRQINREFITEETIEKAEEAATDKFAIVNKDEIDSVVRNIIFNKRQTWRSFSKTMNGVKQFSSFAGREWIGSRWLVEANISGLDIEKLYEKYKEYNIQMSSKDDYDEEWETHTISEVQGFLVEEEVLAPQTTDFKLLGCMLSDGSLKSNYEIELDKNSYYARSLEFLD